MKQLHEYYLPGGRYHNACGSCKSSENLIQVQWDKSGFSELLCDKHLIHSNEGHKWESFGLTIAEQKKYNKSEFGIEPTHGQVCMRCNSLNKFAEANWPKNKPTQYICFECR